MAVNGELNLVGQQRVDVPHLRMVESGVRYDFDVLGYILNEEASYIVKGFEVLGTPVGSEAVAIVVKAAGSKMIHPLASESGSFFAVPLDRENEILDAAVNARVSGACQPSTTNYIGLDLKRSADATTEDSLQIYNPSDDTEIPQKLPLRRTLDYVWVISQTNFDFDKSIAPWAIVTTNDQNAVTSFIDARRMWGRLAPGGSVTTEITPYGWPGGRPANEATATSVLAGDKSLTGLKPWMNAVMTRLWEIGGGRYWYSITADRNVSLNTGASVFASTGESFEIVGGHLHWKGVSFSFDNSINYTISVVDQTTDSVGLTDLGVGECIYVDLERSSGSTVTAQKGALTSLGGSNRPGQRWVIVRRIGSNYYVTGQPWPIGSSFNLATVAQAGVLKATIDADPLNPIAVTMNTDVIGYGFATAKGLSHNLDVGEAHALDASDDVQIGRGEDAGDEDVKIVTDGEHSAFVLGQGSEDYPYLVIARGGYSGAPNAPQAKFAPGSTPFDLGLGECQFEGTVSWSLKRIDYLPLPPILDTEGGFLRGQGKYFMRSNKTWKDPVKYMMASFHGDLWSWNGTNKTITRTTTIGQLRLDELHFASLDDRILVNVAGFEHNGIYAVTEPGGATNAVLTLDSRSGGVGGVEDAGLGFDLFDGVAVYIQQGDHYGGLCAVLDCPQIAQTVDTSIYAWHETDVMTMDEFCVMFHDGTYVTLASGPQYVGFTI